MLQRLYVKNFAIIDEIEIDFRNCLNIMTGETGSGKSIVIGSINCALGGKVAKEMIRQEAEYAYVELEFVSERQEARDFLKKYELPEENGQYTISRRIMQNGRSIVKVNGETSTQAAVKELAEVLLDIHGQHEHQSLLYKKNHLMILDRFAAKREETVLPHLQSAYREYSNAKKTLQEENKDSASRQREISLLEYECNEIRAAQLSPGEKDELTSKYKRLSNQKAIVEALGTCYRLTGQDTESAAENIGHGLRSLMKVSGMDEKISQMQESLTELENGLSDFNREISEYLSDMEEEGDTLEEVSTRLDLIHHLESKYSRTTSGSGEEAILEYLKEAEEKLEKYSDYDAYLSGLQHKLEAAEAELKKYSTELGRIRREEAGKLSVEITKALQELNFQQVKFEIRVEDTGTYSADGTEEAEFLVSLNPGEGVLPLAQIASGGELSRIMLGIKSVMADRDEIETLIFDEIDSGISGRTAQKVSERLAVISRQHQVICITHLPQIAAMADTHFTITKSTKNGRTSTNISSVDETESIEEIARLLGGAKITESVLQNAREMKELAQELK